MQDSELNVDVNSLQDELESFKKTEETVINELQGVDSYVLPQCLFYDTSTRLKDILNPEGDSRAINSNNRSHRILLSEPVYIDDIVVKTSEFYSFHSFGFRFLLGEKEIDKLSVKLDKSKDEFSVSIKRVVDLIEFKTPKSHYKNPVIELIVIKGIELSRIGEIENVLSSVDEKVSLVKEDFESIEVDYNDYIAGYERKKQELRDLSERKSELVGYIENQEKEAFSLGEEVESLKEELDLIKNNIMSRKGDFEEVDRSCFEKEEVFKQLAKDIAVGESKLKGLNSNINLFPSELSDFAKEGGDSVKRYLWVSVIPMLVILFMSYNLYSSSSDLAFEYFTKYKDLSVFDIILSRTPYVLLSFAIISICSKLVYDFVNEAIRITNQRLSLSKVSIIAKDVSDSSCFSLKLTDDEMYEKRTAMKMELLREHLKSYISEDYRYGEKELGDETEITEEKSSECN